MFKLRRHLRYFSNVRSASTIYALSSGSGRCGVAVVRLSGPESGPALDALTENRKAKVARKACLKSLKHPRSKEQLDKALTL